jgi:hypothetical protein
MRSKRTASAMLVCAASIALPCFSQDQVEFNTTIESTSLAGARNLYSIDVNNDGRPDLIRTSSGLPNVLTVFLSNGDGTFKSSYSYQFSTQYQGNTPVATGDFNGDGKADLVIELAGFAQLAGFAGNGDGTFKAPVIENITLPSRQIFGGEEMIVADYNRDGKEDLVTVGSTSLLRDIVLIPGEGNGQFGAAKVVYTAPADHGPGWSIRAGDFDADGKADFAFSESYNCSQGGCSAGIVHVEYGDGAGSFTNSTAYNSSGYVFTFNTGDLNNDGHTDIFGFSEGAGAQQLITLYGQSSRTFHLYTSSTGNGSGLINPVSADFNGDGANDIAALGFDSASNAHFVMTFLGNNTPGTFTPDQINVTPGSDQDLVAGDFNRDMKPDLAWTLKASSGMEIITERNGTTTGAFTHGCSYPAKGQGINACTTTGSSTSVAFHATAASFGKMRKLELWVDGKKIGEQRHDWGDHYTFFNLSSTLAAGSHEGTYYAADVDNRLQRSDFGFSVGSSSACSAPSSAGVHVCKPANGSTVGSPVAVQASATISGTLARMEVWVDGVKRYTETTSKSFSTSIALGTGKHRFGVYAVNTAGTKWESTVYAIVN